MCDISFTEARWRNSFTTRQSHFTPRQSPDVKIKYQVTSVRMFIKKVKQTTTCLLATDCFVQVLFDFLGFLAQPPHLEQKIYEYILETLHDHLCQPTEDDLCFQNKVLQIKWVSPEQFGVPAGLYIEDLWGQCIDTLKQVDSHKLPARK